MERICDEFSSSAVPSFHSFIVPTFQSSYFTLSRFPISPLNVHALILLKVFLLFQKIEPSPFLSLRMNKKSCLLPTINIPNYRCLAPSGTCNLLRRFGQNLLQEIVS